MTAILLRVAPLLMSIAIVFLASGLQIVLVPARAALDGFSTAAIGALGTAFYIGVVAGSWVVPWAVAQAGHIRTFGAMTATAASIAIAYPFIDSAGSWGYVAWFALRMLSGLTIAGLYMVPESWLNEAAEAAQRGRLFSAYVIVQSGAMMLGQLLLLTGSPDNIGLFALMTVLFCLSMLPVTLTSANQPRWLETARLDLRKVWRISPLGAAGAGAAGALHGIFFTLAPVYAQSTGGAQGSARFMAAALLGGIVAQYPLGILSDRVDRRYVILLAVVGAMAMVGIFLLVPNMAAVAALVVTAGFGACLLPIYALFVAHANDFAAEGQFVPLSCALVLLYGVGAIIGPAIASTAMAWFGPQALWQVFLAGLGATAAMTALRMAWRAPIPAAERDDFIAMPGTSVAAVVLDPRGEEEDGATS